MVGQLTDSALAERFACSVGQAVLMRREIPEHLRWSNDLDLLLQAQCHRHPRFHSGHAAAHVTRCTSGVKIEGYWLSFSLTGDGERWTEATVTVTFPPPVLPEISGYDDSGQLVRHKIETPQPMCFKAELNDAGGLTVTLQTADATA